MLDRAFTTIIAFTTLLVCTVNAQDVCEIPLDGITFPDVPFPTPGAPIFPTPIIPTPTVPTPTVPTPTPPTIETPTGTISIFDDDDSIINLAGALPATREYGSNHNKAMSEIEKNIQAEIEGENPLNMESFVNIIASQILNVCMKTPMCVALIETFIKQAIQYVLSERLSFSEDNGRRKLHEVIPNYNLSGDVTETLERILFGLEDDDEHDILNTLDNLYEEINSEDVFSDRFDKFEKDLLLGAISIAKGSTSYWFNSFTNEDENSVLGFRRLGGSNPIIDCYMGEGKVTGCRDCESDDSSSYYHSYSDDYYSDDHYHRSRLLRGGQKIASIMNDAILQRMSITEQLINREERKLGKDKNDKKNDKKDEKSNDRVMEKFTRDDDYDEYKRSETSYEYRSDDDFSIDVDIDLGIPTPDLSIDVHPSIKLKRSISWLYFLIRADVIGFVSGFVVGRACPPVAAASSVIFSSTYVMCY